MSTILKYSIVILVIIGAGWSTILPDGNIQKNKLATKTDDLSDLKLLNFESTSPKKNFFVILFPGDGGWRGVIDYVAKGIAYTHHNVVGFNSLPYFYQERTPESVANDLQRVIKKYSAQWKIDTVVILGYSFTSEILPFIYNRLDKEYQNKVKKMLMLAPSNYADFRASRIYHYDTTKGMKVLPEMEKIKPSLFVIYCDIYKESICNVLPHNSQYKVVKVNSHHLFLGHYKDITNIIVKTLDEIGLEK